MTPTARQRQAIRRTAAFERARVERRIDRNKLGQYRLPNGDWFRFSAADLEANEELQRAYVQAVLLAETTCRNATWN